MLRPVFVFAIAAAAALRCQTSQCLYTTEDVLKWRGNAEGVKYKKLACLPRADSGFRIRTSVLSVWPFTTTLQ